VPLLAIINLWRYVSEHVDDPGVGVRLGATIRTRDLGLVGYAMYYSDTLLHALVRLARYIRIVNEAIQIKLEPDGDNLRVVLEAHPALDAIRHPVDCRLTTVLAYARELTGVDLVPVAVRFPYRRIETLGAHKRFFRAPLEFGCSRSELVFRQRDVDRPVQAADETLTGYLDGLAHDVLEGLAEGSFVDKVRRVVWSELSGGQPTLQRVATQIGVSVRTLQRRLGEQGTSFATVLERLRRDLAIHLLSDRSLAVYEVAFLLGYSEPSTFSRAFRRWHEISPQAYRDTVTQPRA
jgi:AraC-like DNA-binding protein